MYTIYADGELLYSDIYPNHSRKVTSPTLKMGVDEAGSLEFTMSEVNKCYTKLERMKTIVTVRKNDIPFWDGRVVEEYRDWNKNKKMHVEGALTFLNDTTQPIKEYKNVSFAELITAILSVHNGLVDEARQIFWGGIPDAFNPEDLEYWSTAYEETFTALKNIIDYFGCHVVLRKDPSDKLNKLYFFKNAMGVSNQTIMFGDNLLDYTENYDLSKLATVLLPLCKTDRESADAPRSPGTDVDLSHVQPYDESKHYGVFMAKTHGYLCRKFLASDVHRPVTIPPHRNELNLIAELNDGAYVITRPDVLGAPVGDNRYTWSIPEFVQIWFYTYREGRHGRDPEYGTIEHYTLEEAQNANVYSTPISNGIANFMHITDLKPSVTYHQNYDKVYTDGNTTINNDVRSYRDRAIVVLQNLVEDYGIITPLKDGQCAILEIDYTHFKSLYLTASHAEGFTENYRSISIWKKSLSFDESTSFVARSRERGRTSTEGWIFASGKKIPDQSIPGQTRWIDCYMPAFGYSVGYKMNPSANPDTCAFDDLVEDSVPTILNQSKYEFVREIEDVNCFERKIDISIPFNAETDSPRILVVISGNKGPFGVTLVNTDDENTDSSVAIGMDPNGVDVSKAHYVRLYTDVNNWKPDSQYTPEEWAQVDPIHHHANDIYDEDLGYGVLVPATTGYRLITKSEYEEIKKPSFNIFNSGAINTVTCNTGIITGDHDNDDHRVTVYVTKASYEDANGKKYPNSIYITTKLKGKSGLYAIYEFTDGNGNNGVWDVDSGDKPGNQRELKDSIEFGKYINGFTTLEAKKITMPYSKDPNRLMFVVVGSTGESPKIHVHDPKQAEKLQYLTISSVNNGDPKIKASSINRFTSALEYGEINIQNGSLMNNLTYERIRTKEPLLIKADGSYMFMFEQADPTAVVSADVFIYGKIDGYLGHTGFQTIRSQNPYILLPYLYEGYSLNVMFRKIHDSSVLEMTTNDVLYPMIWREDKATTLLFTQGSLTAVTDPVTNYVELESDATNTHVISTADYYTATDEKCTLKVAIELDSSVIPATVTVDGMQYVVASRTVYVSYLEQSPDIEVDPDGSTRHVVYKSYDDPHIVHQSTTYFSMPSKNNMRYKFYAYYDIEYVDEYGDTQTVDHNDIEFLPSHVKTFSIVSYTDDHKTYVPPNDSFDKYGYIEKRIEFDGIESSAELKEKAEQYLYQSQFDEMTLKVKALDMSVVKPNEEDGMDVGYSVKTISPPHGLYRDFPITELSIPFDDVSGTTYELGYDNKDSLNKLMQGG